MPKKKLHKLILDQNSNIILIGVVSHENDYRLSWTLNQKLAHKFVRIDDMQVYNAKYDLNVAYSRYFLESKPELDCYLISNKSENGFLISKYKNVDFVLRISLGEGMESVNSILEDIKGVDVVITAFVLEDIPAKVEKLFDF